MRATLGGLALAVAAALPACQCCVDGVAPHAVSAQPLGARCGGSFSGTECADGLACIARTCTISCGTSQAACPAGSICMEGARDGNGNLLWICLPTCAGGTDCLLGATVGDCTASHADPGICLVRSCATDDECRGAGRCVGVSEARGITWNETCADGWCQL